MEAEGSSLPAGRRRGQRRRRRGRAQSPQAPLEARAAPPSTAPALVSVSCTPFTTCPRRRRPRPSPGCPCSHRRPLPPPPPPPGRSRPLRLERGHRPRRHRGTSRLEHTPLLPRLAGPHLLHAVETGHRPGLKKSRMSWPSSFQGLQAVVERPLLFQAGVPPQLSGISWMVRLPMPSWT